MATHNLEENQDHYILPAADDEKFVYTMYHISGELKRHVQSIDLRRDKLVIYGTEIKESTLDRLHQSLIFKQRNGCILVNCRGACHFWGVGKGYSTPVHNVIFDWSQFGVIVPNSTNDSLRKELEQKDKRIEEMNQQLSSAEAEVSSTKAALDASKKEVEDMKELLSACKRDQSDMEAKLKKICSQLSLADLELESKNIKLESSMKEVNELGDRLAASKEGGQNMEVELQKLRDQLSAVNAELQSTTSQLKLSNESLVEFEDQLSSCKKETQNMELELQKLQGQLSLVNSELQSTKTQLESSDRIVKEPEDQLAFVRKERLANQMELQKLQDELSSVHPEIYSAKSLLESLKERMKELEDQFSASKQESQEIGAELQKVQHQLTSVIHELQFTKSLSESSVKMLHELKDQLFNWQTKGFDGLAELQKIEEAKLITELAETDAVNYRLVKQAYTASVDASKFLDQYEMSRLLRGQYDMHGTSLVIKAGEKGIYSEIWAERLLNMYVKWAEKLGHKGRVLEKCVCRNGGIKSAAIEFEFEYAYGYLIGEKGVHCMMDSLEESTCEKASFAAVDIIPLFLQTVSEAPIVDDKDLIISCNTSNEGDKGSSVPLIHIQHIPTGICVQSSGERNKFANKMKALNRLKAKLLMVLSDQRVSDVSKIKRNAIIDIWEQDTRRYILQPYKLVQDLKTGVQLRDLNSVLKGDLDLFISAHINLRRVSEKN